MVLIWTKETRRRLDVIFVPESILNDMIETHLERKFPIDTQKTCFVNSDNDLIGIPPENQIIQLLKEILDKNILMGGFDMRMKMPHHWFNNIKCCEFIMTRNGSVPSNDVFECDFIITFFRVEGRAKKSIQEIKKRPWISLSKSDEMEIIKIFKDAEVKNLKEFVFIME